MIYIDDRVGSKELKPHIAKDIDTELTRMDFGDASFLGNGPDDSLMAVGIERKAITDLLSSMTTGRLSGHQLVGLLQSYGMIYILVEGIYQTDPRSGLLTHLRGKSWKPIQLGTRRFMGREVNNYLNTLSILCGVNIVKTQNLHQSGMWISDTYKWWQKRWEEHSAHMNFVRPHPGIQLKKPSFEQRVYKELDGVGWKRSLTIVEHFPTIFELCMADEKQLMAVPGVGKTLARKIMRQVAGTKEG